MRIDHKREKKIHALRIIGVILALFLCSGIARGQVSVNLAPVARQQFLAADGSPLAGGFVYTYLAGTSTPAATYVDSSGLIQNTNPITLDSGGFASIWLAAQKYKFVVTDQFNAQQWEVDNIPGANLNIFLTGQLIAPDITMPEENCPTSTVVYDILCANIVGHRLGMLNNGGLLDFIVGQNSTDTLANKTLTSPIINSPTIMGATFSTPIISTVITGTAPFTIASTTVVPNLNVSALNGATFASPGPIGITSPSSGAFTSLTVNGATVNGGWLSYPPTTGAVTVQNTASEGTLQSVSIGAGDLNSVGKVLEIHGFGLNGSSSSPPNLTINIRLDSVSGTVIATSGVIAHRNYTGITWSILLDCATLSTGSSGTISCQGTMNNADNEDVGGNNSIVAGLYQVSPATVDLTASHLLYVTALWSEADAQDIITQKLMTAHTEN